MVQRVQVLITSGERILLLLVVCPSDLNDIHSFLEGPKAALTASKDFHDGHYTTTPSHGIRAFARAFSAWAYGQTVSSSTVKCVGYPF